MSVAAPVKIAEYAVSGTNSATSGAVPLTQAVPAGTLLVLVASAAGASRPFTPSSSAGLTWTPCAETWPTASTGNAGTAAMWYTVTEGALTTSDTVTVTINAASVLAMRCWMIEGADPTDPVAAIVQGELSTDAPTLTLPSLTCPAGGMVVGGGGGGGGGAPVLDSVAAGYTITDQALFTGASSTRLIYTYHQACAVETSTTPSSTQGTSSGRRQFAMAIAVNPADPPEPPDPVPGDVVHMWTGAPTATGAVVHTKTTAATSVRLAVSTSDDMTSPTYVAAESPDGYGYVRHTLTGLTPDTRYYVRAADTPTGGTESLVGPVGTIHTLATPGTPAPSRKVVIGGCLDTLATETAALESALAWAPDWGHFNGDFFYNGNVSLVTESAWVGRYDTQIAGVGAPLQGFLAAGVAAYELVSDHDTTNTDNGDSNIASAPYELAGWRAVVPHLAGSGDSTCRDQQWDDGRVSYFMVDCRSVERTSGSATDDSSKTMLGAAQKARLFDWLESNPAPFKVIISDPPWMGAPDVVAKPDAWWSYASERQQIIDAIAAQDHHVEIWHGDSHLIGYATPAMNTWGGIPVLCAAPYWQDGGGRNLSTYTEHFNNSSEWAAEYGRITITDDGTQIVRTFVGWDALSDEAKFTYTTTVDTAPPEPPTGDVVITAWVGGQEISVALTVHTP